MLRTPVHIRDAAPDDADALVDVWGGVAVRAGERDSTPASRQEAVASIGRSAADPDQRLLVALVDDRVAGAAHLSRAPLSPVHSESAVHVLHLQVIEEFRRHGVGRGLMEATVSWAEQTDTPHVIAATTAASRDANRFMARLGLGQVAVLRGASVTALRAKLPVETPVAARVGSRTHRRVGQVLVKRRSLRRAQARP